MRARLVFSIFFALLTAPPVVSAISKEDEKHVGYLVLVFPRDSGNMFALPRSKARLTIRASAQYCTSKNCIKICYELTKNNRRAVYERDGYYYPVKMSMR